MSILRKERLKFTLRTRACVCEFDPSITVLHYARKSRTKLDFIYFLSETESISDTPAPPGVVYPGR